MQWICFRHFSKNDQINNPNALRVAFHFPLPLHVSELWAWAFDEAFWAACLIIRLRAVGQLLGRLLWKSLIYLQRSRMAPSASPADMSAEDKLQSRLFNKNKVSLACFPSSYFRSGREVRGWFAVPMEFFSFHCLWQQKLSFLLSKWNEVNLVAFRHAFFVGERESA